MGEQSIRPDAETENDGITTPHNEVESDHDGKSLPAGIYIEITGLMSILFQGFVQEPPAPVPKTNRDRQ